MADGNYYGYPQLAIARARAEEQRNEQKKKLEAYQRPRSPLMQAAHVAAVVGAGGAASYWAGSGGVEGRTLLGVPVELLMGAGMGGVGAILVSRGSDPKRRPEDGPTKSEIAADLLLVAGASAIATYTNRWLFAQGVKRAPPPEAANENQVSGALQPPTTICYLPAPAHWMLPAQTQAPAMVPAQLPAQVPAPAAVTAGDSPLQEYFAPVMAEETTSIGADEIQSAVEILDRMNRQ